MKPFQVSVAEKGNIKTTEHTINCDASYGVEFVEEIRTHGKAETISQRWPVCPYTVSVSNRSTRSSRASLYIDGQKVASKIVHEGQRITFEGVATEKGIQELLFSLPRYATVEENKRGGRSLPDWKVSELGTIKVVWQDSVKTGVSLMKDYRTHITSSFKQANKHDASGKGLVESNLAGTGGDEASGESTGKFASTTRLGKVVGLNEPKKCTVFQYECVGQPWSACVHYRTKEYLEELGVVDPVEIMTEQEKEERLAMRLKKRQKRRAKFKAERDAKPSPPPVLVLGPPQSQSIDKDSKPCTPSPHS